MTITHLPPSSTPEDVAAVLAREEIPEVLRR